MLSDAPIYVSFNMKPSLTAGRRTAISRYTKSASTFCFLGSAHHMLQEVLKFFFSAPHECFTAGERLTENIMNVYQIHPSYIEIGPFKVCVYRYSQNPF